MFDEDIMNPVAAAVTHFNVYPSIKSINVDLLGGSSRDLWVEPFFDTLSQFARDNGFATVEACGRKGWPRALKGVGVEATGVTFEVPVS